MSCECGGAGGCQGGAAPSETTGPTPAEATMASASQGTMQMAPPAIDHSAFDVFNPPDPSLISDCVHCGFCLPACPTYQLWGREEDSPRGRIYLMQEGLENGPMNAAMVEHFDACLGCMACVTACPSGVQYDKLIEATRGQVERNGKHHRSRAENGLREAIDRDAFQADGDSSENWTLAAGTAAAPEVLADLEFAWKACRAVKSNAIDPFACQ